MEDLLRESGYVELGACGGMLEGDVDEGFTL